MTPTLRTVRWWRSDADRHRPRPAYKAPPVDEPSWLLPPVDPAVIEWAARIRVEADEEWQRIASIVGGGS